ncbi:MAG: cell division protein SepF [Candidatus Eremiobacteraeota bacterium]|nr:cell division protein SepF [Candidatus Eremiobacteraeota bacterium]
MSVLQRIGAFFSLQDEDEEYLEAPEPETPAPRRNVVAFAARDGRRNATEVSVFVPHSFADVTEVADALRARQVVIVNLQGADRGLLQRVVDFTSGVAYTLDGRIQKLAEAMYLVVPPGVSVNAQGIRESLGSDSMLDFMNARNG